MNILVFTRIEGGTGGDKEQLLTIMTSIIEGLQAQGGDHTANLVLAYDEASEKNIEGVKNDWMQLGGTNVWPNQRALDQGNANLKLNFNIRSLFVTSKQEVRSFIENTDYFVICGWAHQLQNDDVEHMRNELHIPTTAKILVVSAYGKEINSRFITALKEQEYNDVYTIQTGFDKPAGFPMKEELIINTPDTRTAWLNHLNINQVNTQEMSNSPVNSRADKLIVIYCSKDPPGLAGKRFINNIPKGKRNYPVILIGAEQNEMAGKLWIKDFNDVGIKNIHCIPRTQNQNNIKGSEILMQGLHDAEFSMATGAFSILQAKRLDIQHCQYLAPRHLGSFARELKEIETLSSQEQQDKFTQIFDENGENTKDELRALFENKPNQQFRSIQRVSPPPYSQGMDALAPANNLGKRKAQEVDLANPEIKRKPPSTRVSPDSRAPTDRENNIIGNLKYLHTQGKKALSNAKKIDESYSLDGKYWASADGSSFWCEDNGKIYTIASDGISIMENGATWKLDSDNSLQRQAQIEINLREAKLEAQDAPSLEPISQSPKEAPTPSFESLTALAIGRNYSRVASLRSQPMSVDERAEARLKRFGSDNQSQAVNTSRSLPLNKDNLNKIKEKTEPKTETFYTSPKNG